jgi:hypothetical protein
MAGFDLPGPGVQAEMMFAACPARQQMIADPKRRVFGRSFQRSETDA